MKRIVTGVGEDGVSRVISSGPAPTIFRNPKSAGGGRVEAGAGISKLGDCELLVEELWSTSEVPPLATSSDPTTAMEWSSGVERPGATRWRLVHHGPNRVAALHETGTIDYDTLLEGELDLLLDADEIALQPGDCVVIPNVSHGWRAGPNGATLLVVMLGI